MLEHLKIVDQVEHKLFVLSRSCKWGQFDLRIRVGASKFVLVLLDHEKANVEEVGRLADDTLANFKFHTLL